MAISDINKREKNGNGLGETDCSRITRWAVKMPDMGPAVYRITDGDKEHKHAYHIFCPWSPDGKLLTLARYDRVNPDLEVCVMDTSSGEINPVGVSRKWDSHSVAFQQWLGNKQKIMYRSAGKEDEEFVIVNPDGTGYTIFKPKDFTARYCSLDGMWVYGVTPLPVLFPGDNLAGREDKGVLRYNVETGEREVVFSIVDALALVPDAEKYKDCHLYAKMTIVHQKSGRVIFNLTNTFWDRDGKEPRVRHLISMNGDGSDATYIGRVHHHPNWHPFENRIIGNVMDFNGEVRFGLYNGDGSGLLEYVPRTNGAGHPTISLDGKWICTDGKGGDGFDNSLILCEPDSGKEIYIAKFSAVSDNYPSFKAIDSRSEGETVLDAVLNSREALKCWQTQCHSTWSRDGSAILFNRDAGDGKGSQLYMIDVTESIAALT